MEPFGGAGIMWLPDNTEKSKREACAVVYTSPTSRPVKRPKKGK